MKELNRERSNRVEGRTAFGQTRSFNVQLHTPVTKRAAWPRRQRVDETSLVPSQRNKIVFSQRTKTRRCASRLLVSAPRLSVKGAWLASHSALATSPTSPRRVCCVRIYARRDQRAPRVPTVKACSMASSLSQRGADTRAPPPLNQHAAFYKLVDKRTIAGVLCRHARAAELSAQAAVQAKALFGDDSLVVACLRMGESDSLTALYEEASGAEKELHLRRSWTVLLSLIPPLLRRLEANTLLPGTLRAEELDYDAHVQAAVRIQLKKPVPSLADLRALASTLGYTTLMDAMFRGLSSLRQPLWPAAQKRSVESFVLQGLDVIPRTAGIPAYLIGGEDDLVMVIEKRMSPHAYDPAFCAAVLRKWRSESVSSVLRARGVLQTGIAKHEQTKAEFYARQRADIAKHGLRDCALPSCSKTEKTVKEFAGCSGCRTVVYCCLEHQALDWKAHKKACREKEAARLAEEEEAGNAGASIN